MIQKGDVVGLSYHVDYWNYLGWTDSLASKEKYRPPIWLYARAGSQRGLYASGDPERARPRQGRGCARYLDRLDAFKREGKGLSVPVSSKFAGDEVEIDIGAGRGKADVVVAYFTREQTVDVQKGDNQGKKISYWHSVYDVQTVGMWDGSAMTVKLPASVVAKVKKGGCAVLLQTAKCRR